MRNEDEWGDWLYEVTKDRKMDAELEERESFKNKQRLYDHAIKHDAWFQALRYANQMNAIANRLGNSHLMSIAGKCQERADRLRSANGGPAALSSLV